DRGGRPRRRGAGTDQEEAGQGQRGEIPVSGSEMTHLRRHGGDRVAGGSISPAESITSPVWTAAPRGFSPRHGAIQGSSRSAGIPVAIVRRKKTGQPVFS